GNITELFNGNYVVVSPNWNNGAVGGAGAVTFGNGLTGTTGRVDATNSLVGSTAGDQVGSRGVRQLANTTGNYVVISPNWNNGTATQAGAVTLVDGSNGNIVATGTPGGAVSATNSLVGSSTNDHVGGSSGLSASGVAPLFIDGNYVVISPDWNV